MTDDDNIVMQVCGEDGLCVTCTLLICRFVACNHACDHGCGSLYPVRNEEDS